MLLLYIVLAFLIPVVMVFGYSVWLNRRRQTSNTAELADKTDAKVFSDLLQRCTVLKNSAITAPVPDIQKDIDRVLVVARSLKDQGLREQSLSHVMSIYVTIGHEKEARALLSEVKDETNRADIIKNVFGNVV